MTDERNMTRDDLRDATATILSRVEQSERLLGDRFSDLIGQFRALNGRLFTAQQDIAKHEILLAQNAERMKTLGDRSHDHANKITALLLESRLPSDLTVPEAPTPRRTEGNRIVTVWHVLLVLGTVGLTIGVLQFLGLLHR